MTSFNKLFSNIPLKETLNLYVKRLGRNQTHVGSLTKARFISCLRLQCLDHFLYLTGSFMNNDKMDPPIGCTFTNVCFCQFENI